MSSLIIKDQRWKSKADLVTTTAHVLFNQRRISCHKKGSKSIAAVAEVGEYVGEEYDTGRSCFTDVPIASLPHVVLD